MIGNINASSDVIRESIIRLMLTTGAIIASEWIQHTHRVNGSKASALGALLHVRPINAVLHFQVPIKVRARIERNIAELACKWHQSDRNRSCRLVMDSHVTLESTLLGEFPAANRTSFSSLLDRHRWLLDWRLMHLGGLANYRRHIGKVIARSVEGV